MAGLSIKERLEPRIVIASIQRPAERLHSTWSPLIVRPFREVRPPGDA
jgi:hypothetical protein